MLDVCVLTVTPPRYEVPPGLEVALLGEAWVAFSPLSGETMVLNDESAAILEILRERPDDLPAVCAALATDVGLEPAEVERTLGPSWSQIVEAGLIAQMTRAA